MDRLGKKLAFGVEDNNKVLRAISSIERFRGRWDPIQKEGRGFLKELRKVATVQSIGSSTRIEGASLTDKEVEKLLSKVEITAFETRDEQEVVGYHEALELILDNQADMPINEGTILTLHGILLRHSSKDDRHRGGYKNLPNSVVATYPDGTKKTIFETTPPHLVRKEMETLVEWTRSNLKTGDLHPLLVIGLFVYEFLSIHPFQDGNGRLSRLLTTLLLLRMDYGFIQYISFEHQIENRKSGYYRALMNCQRRRRKGKAEDISEWIHYFLGSLQDLGRKLEKKVEGLEEAAVYLNPRQKLILEYIRRDSPAKLADIHSQFPAENLNTLKKDLQKLVEDKLISKTGDRKAATYRPASG